MADKQENLDFKSASTASGAGAQAAGGGAAPNGGGAGRGGMRAARVAAAVLAVALIAFCAWSMSEYVQGRDPLAFATGSTLRADAPARSKASASVASAKKSSGAGTKTAAIDEAAVKSELKQLRLGKEDLAVTGDVRVVVTESGIWVEHAQDQKAESLVQDAARRTLALARWVAGRKADATVTWIEEDASGIVRMSVALPSASAAKVKGTDVAHILSAASGYAIDSQSYAQLGKQPFSAEGGKAPTLPSGSTLAVGTAATTGAHDGSSANGSANGSLSSENAKTSTGSGRAAGGAAGEKGAASGSAATSGSGSGSGGKGTAAMTVSISINGAGYRVSLRSGATAYDALLATGASVESGAYAGGGTWVTAINGLGQDASHGWTYSVNGSMPGMMSDLYAVHDGDSVVWGYVTSGQ
jgi:hypothetical protein